MLGQPRQVVYFQPLTAKLYRIKPGQLPPDPVVPPREEDDDDDDTPPVPPSSRKPGEERRAHPTPRSIACGFCECEITTMEGGIVKFSKRARELRDASELIDSLKAKIADLEEKNSELKSRLSTPPAVETKKKGGWFSE